MGPFDRLTDARLSFATPWAFLLLAALPVWWLYRHRARPAAMVFSRVSVLATGPRAGRLVRRLAFLLRNLALVAAIVAVARPRLGGHTEESTSEGINIVIAFDISSSMLSMDFQPQNRVEVARSTLKQFVNMRKNDRIGLVAFAAEALTQVPLTTDYPVVKAAIDNLAPGQLEDGTAIGTAIATAANRLRDPAGKSRVMILLTDGQNNRGTIDPRTAARAAAVFGIKIYAIGVGTRGMAPVPVARGLFGLRFENRPVDIDDALLTDVAQATGGRYFRATNAEALRQITEQIDQLERTPVQTRRYVRFTEMYRWPLGIALAALMLELGVLAKWSPLP